MNHPRKMKLELIHELRKARRDLEVLEERINEEWPDNAELFKPTWLNHIFEARGCLRYSENLISEMGRRCTSTEPQLNLYEPEPISPAVKGPCHG